MEKFKKDYLSAQEINDLMILGTLLDTTAAIIGVGNYTNPTSQKIRKSWKDRNFLTKDEHRFLKTAETNMTKFYESVIYRLNPEEVKKIYKRSANFNFRILDEFTLKKINRDYSDRMKMAGVPREMFENWCEEILQVKCKNCTEHWNNCKLHEVFDDNLVPESGWCLDNCKYAYTKIEKKEV